MTILIFRYLYKNFLLCCSCLILRVMSVVLSGFRVFVRFMGNAPILRFVALRKTVGGLHYWLLLSIFGSV